MKKMHSLPLGGKLQDRIILAPLTRGGNYPFRRLCQDFGMQVSLGEMVYARHLLQGEAIEQARLRRPPGDDLFGVQIATNDPHEGAAAMKLAHEAGADFVDLNCGCPIYEATRRGLGSALLRSPAKLGNLVQAIRKEASSSSCEIPLTVKIRLGCELDTMNVQQVAREVREAGAAALTIHGRTAQQGYKKPADWEWIQKVVEENNNANSDMPVIGNGDILTHYEARRRMETCGVDAVMVGRGALTKPWIFQEFRDSQEWEPSVADRIAVYRRLACYMKEYFGDDDVGRKRSWQFLPWHFDFFARYESFPEAEFEAASLQAPLIQKRVIRPDGMPPLETLMCHRNAQAHNLISAALWESSSDAEAVQKLTATAESPEFREILQQKGDDSSEVTELSNIPSTSGKKQRQRKVRTPKPKRSPQEIAAIRAERAAKRAASGITEHVHVNGARRRD